jgi:hypothetical protein
VKDRWRGRRAGLALVAAFVTAAVAATVSGTGDRRTVVVTDLDGTVLARVPLAIDGGFELRYRNSLYGTLAKERFVVMDEGSFRLEALAAEQLAVLEEYYAVNAAPQRGAHDWWTAPPAYELELDELRVAATDLGQRTLLVRGQPSLDLWRLVEDAAPTVTIFIEES